MRDESMTQAYRRIEDALDSRGPLPPKLADALLLLRHLPQGPPLGDAALIPPAPADPPALPPALMASLLQIPEAAAPEAAAPEAAAPETFTSDLLRALLSALAWLARPGPALAFACALLVALPLLMRSGGTEKGPAALHAPAVGHALALHIVTQGPEGEITRRDPAPGPFGGLVVPLSPGEAFQLVLSSPEIPLAGPPRHALVALARPGEAPARLMEEAPTLSPQALPGTRSLYTLPRPLSLSEPPGPARLFLVLTERPVAPEMQAELLGRISADRALPLLSAAEAEALGAVEGSIPLEVRP